MDQADSNAFYILEAPKLVELHPSGTRVPQGCNSPNFGASKI